MFAEEQLETEEPKRPGTGSEPERSEGTDARQSAERGVEAYGGDPDAGPSVTEAEVEAGLERDQAEG